MIVTGHSHVAEIVYDRVTVHGLLVRKWLRMQDHCMIQPA